ncbi:MAG: EamA family transporter RarD [Planctomycetota bacterium]
MPAPVPDTAESTSTASDLRRARGGVLWAVLAYGSWGVFPIYWKQLRHIPAFEVLCHRVLWSCALVGIAMAIQGQLGAIRSALADSKTRRVLLASTALIGVNWFLFIWAVTSGRILQASLGYYMNPLVNVALGRLVLGERISPAAAVAVALAAAGVAIMAAGTGAVPWVAVSLAVTFALYGLCRKTVAVGPLVGLSVETILIAPVAAIALAVLFARGQAATQHATRIEWIFLAGSGFPTAIPLLAFAEAARRLRFITVGILQYIAPTLQFLCAVAIYHEAFTRNHAVAFGCIWGAVAIYAVDSIVRAKAPGKLLPRA